MNKILKLFKMQLTGNGMEYESRFLNILCRFIFVVLLVAIWPFVFSGVFLLSIFKWVEYVWDITDDAMKSISSKLGITPLMKSKWIKVDKLSEVDSE